MAVTCQSCQKRMSPDAVVCPHCGARQANAALAEAPSAPAEPRGPLRVSPAEARALLYTQGASDLGPDPRGPMALFVPRAQSSGWTRATEWALTALAAPLLLAGFMFLMLGRRLWTISDEHEVALTFALGGVGGFQLAAVAGLMGWGPGSTLGLVGVCFGALLLRLWVRRRHKYV